MTCLIRIISILVKYSHNHGLGKSGLFLLCHIVRSLSFLQVCLRRTFNTKIFIRTFSISNMERLETVTVSLVNIT